MKRILVTGSNGMLGSRLLSELGADCLGVDLPEADIAKSAEILQVVNEYRPDLIINAAALTDVDYCETHPLKAEAVHHKGVRNLSETGVRLITLSTDQVFSDGRGNLLLESDKVDPANSYALSKRRGELAALENPSNCVVRTSWLLGEKGIVPWMIKKLETCGTIRAVSDQTACITILKQLVDALLTLAFDEGRTGLYHCVNRGAVTPFYIACIISRRMGRGRVVPVEWAELSMPAPRPVWSALGTEREIVMPPFEEAMEICLKKIL